MKPNQEELKLAQGICSIVLAYKHADMAILEPRFDKMPQPTAADAVARIVAVHCEGLRELAEIGRLAVEEEKLRRALKAKYLASGGKTADCMGLYDDFYGAAITHREAVCAYLAKHPTEKP